MEEDGVPGEVQELAKKKKRVRRMSYCQFLVIREEFIIMVKCLFWLKGSNWFKLVTFFFFKRLIGESNMCNLHIMEI